VDVQSVAVCGAGDSSRLAREHFQRQNALATSCIGAEWGTEIETETERGRLISRPCRRHMTPPPVHPSLLVPVGSAAGYVAGAVYSRARLGLGWACTLQQSIAEPCRAGVSAVLAGCAVCVCVPTCYCRLSTEFSAVVKCTHYAADQDRLLPSD